MNHTLQNHLNNFARVHHYVCPICHSPLTMDKKTWRCDGSLNDKQTQHSFDVARQGYINLLPVQNKKTKTPGDSAESIMARQAFLQADFYQPLQQLITQLTNQYASNKSHWLDVGCGEGYYTQAIHSCDNVTQLTAVDVSKSAVITLSKECKSKHALWLQDEAGIIPMVASASKLPLKDNSVQGISSIFSPLFTDEFSRVLAPNGILLVVKPDIDHLASVRQGLFDTVRQYNIDKFASQLQVNGFKKLDKQTLGYDIQLNYQNLMNLLTMTPYSYRAKKEKRHALLEHSQHDPLVTKACFVVDVFQLIE